MELFGDFEYQYTCQTKAERDLLSHFLTILERFGCQFFACPGADKPYVDMATCFVCDEVSRIKEAIQAYDLARR